MRLAQSCLSLLLSVSLAIAGYNNTVYLIRHGEKPDDGSSGLAPAGEERAQCLRNSFGDNSNYNIGYIMAQAYKSDGSRIRPYETVKPVADDLGLIVDVSCDRDNPVCVDAAIKAYANSDGSKNVLICWEHKVLTDIAKELGVKNPPTYPDDRFDLIWTIRNKKLVSQDASERCPGLDG